MKKILDKLNEEEYFVVNLIKSLSGTVENTECKLKEIGVPEQYKHIYNDYSQYYHESGSEEALKRIIFIQWYGASEPLAFTGIGELDTELENANLNILADLIRIGSIDSEFKSMILHYYSVSDWYFDSHSEFSDCVESISKKEYKINFELPFNNRGQMGEYWNTLKL